MERQAGTLTAASGTGRHTIWALVSIPQCCWDMRDKAMRPCGASGSTRAVFSAPSPCSSVQVLLARSVARHSLETDSLITLRLLALRLHKPHSRLQSQCAGVNAALPGSTSGAAFRSWMLLLSHASTSQGAVGYNLQTIPDKSKMPSWRAMWSVPRAKAPPSDPRPGMDLAFMSWVPLRLRAKQLRRQLRQRATWMER